MIIKEKKLINDIDNNIDVSYVCILFLSSLNKKLSRSNLIMVCVIKRELYLQ